MLLLQLVEPLDPPKPLSPLLRLVCNGAVLREREGRGKERGREGRKERNRIKREMGLHNVHIDVL